MANIKVVILTYNAGAKFIQLMESIALQKGITFQDIYVIDSSSTDDTIGIAKKYKVTIKIIPKMEFGHGKTRAWAVEHLYADYIVFLTQDVILENATSIIDLCRPLQEDQKIGVVYGRQLPVKEVNFFGNFSRIFNYPDKSSLRTKEDIQKLGIKATFCSDSFAAYNRKNLLAIGNFIDTNFGEDALAAAIFLLNGYKVFYCATARVFHAHDYSLKEEFKRGYDIGKLHKNNKKIFNYFKSAEKEGMKFIITEFCFLRRNKKILIPEMIFRSLCKYLGYKIAKI